jgi:hypothetical protein
MRLTVGEYNIPQELSGVFELYLVGREASV